MDNLTKLFCLIDDFCRVFAPIQERHLSTIGAKRVGGPGSEPSSTSKSGCQIEHARHRSASNFVVNRMPGIIAYCLCDNNPTLSSSKVNLLPQP